MTTLLGNTRFNHSQSTCIVEPRIVATLWLLHAGVQTCIVNHILTLCVIVLVAAMLLASTVFRVCGCDGWYYCGYVVCYLLRL